MPGLKQSVGARAGACCFDHQRASVRSVYLSGETVSDCICIAADLCVLASLCVVLYRSTKDTAVI